MYECFLEIAFEAEVNTKEDPELITIARELCNENPATRATAILDLRKMISDRDEVKPHRIDDEYLLRFLRARHFIVPQAHRLLVRYYAFREQYPELQQGVDLWSFIKMKNVCEGSMMDRPDVGRLSIVRFGLWNPSDLSVLDMLRATMAIAEIGIRQPKIQVLGSTLIVDLEGLTMRQVACLTPQVAYQLVCLLGTSMPVRLRSCHVINYSWILNTFLFIFKRFIHPSFWKKIYFHGYDLKSLHQHIDPVCLPAKYGGTCRNHAATGVWFQKIKKYRDENLDREMKALGYEIKE